MLIDELKTSKLEEIRLLEARLEMQRDLPHKYGWKFYTWARTFYESTNKENLLVAANQISKSSTGIRKAIEWAGNTDLWERLWPRAPLQFWYLYPTFDVATIEFKKKWVPEFMPRGAYKEHATYGWKPEWKNGQIVAMHFNSGVSIYFKSYATDVQSLQTGSVDAMWLDEECPEELLAELQMRLIARGGYFHALFTPTLGQEIWRCAFEEIGKKAETYKGALKLQVSMYDCLQYEDGSKSPWTIEAIQRAINACKSDAQVQRRVYGRFVSDEGLKYASFERKRNIVPAPPLDKRIPKGWDIIGGVDVGSGGDNHPSAIVLIAVSPDKKRGKVIRGWRGDDVLTTAADVAHKVLEMMAGISNTVTNIFYDWASADFYTIAQEMGLNVEPAQKSHSVGEQVLNVLFRNQMLDVYDLPELEPLAVELTTLKAATPKRHAKDDFADALRYAVTRVPWDWSDLLGPKHVEVEKEKTELELRREQFMGSAEDMVSEFDAYIQEINGLLELDAQIGGGYEYEEYD